MKEIFKDTTGIPDYENMTKNPEYFRENKKVEIFYIDMNPSEYLKIIEKGFKEIDNGEYNFKKSRISLSRIDKIISQGEKLDMPYLYERYQLNWERDEEIYSFGQEGRHRSIKAMELGIKKIKVAYIKSIDLDSRIGMDKFIEVKLNKEKEEIEELLEYGENSKEIIKDVMGDIVDFDIGIKRYLNNNIAGYTPYSLTDGEPKIYLNYFIKQQIKDREISSSMIEDICIDSILHEYGHLVYELLNEKDNIMDKVKDIYSKRLFSNNNKGFKEKLTNIVDYDQEEIEDNIEYYIDDYLDMVIEEEFAEDFSKYCRLENNNMEYFMFVQSIEELGIDSEKKDLFDSVKKEVKKELNRDKISLSI